MTETILTINDIQSAMRVRGSHWWDPDTMRFFGTRVCGPVYQGDGGIYFVTSEKPPHGPRGYAIRKYDPEAHNIDTVGDLCQYRSRQTALRHAAKLAGPNATAEGEELRPVTKLEQFRDDCRKHGSGTATFDQCRQIIWLAKRHHRYMEKLCSDETFCRQTDENGDHPAVERCRNRIYKAAQAIGAKTVHFSGDPRGCTVRLVWADGETNDWAKEGWIIPVN